MLFYFLLPIICIVFLPIKKFKYWNFTLKFLNQNNTDKGIMIKSVKQDHLLSIWYFWCSFLFKLSLSIYIREYYLFKILYN